MSSGSPADLARATSGGSSPVAVDGITVWPGPADDGTGNVTPQYGVSMVGSSSYLQVASGYVQGVSASVNTNSAPFAVLGSLIALQSAWRFAAVSLAGAVVGAVVV